MKVNPIEGLAVKGFNAFCKTPMIKNAGQKVYQNNRRWIDGLGVTSIILKDGLGCYLYVTQSLNNKEIPDDKRKFVASLDLTNGLLMILMQLAMFFTVSHKVCQTKMFDKMFGKAFDRPIKKTYQAIIKNNPKFDKTGKIEFTQDFEKFRNNVKDAFGGITSLAAATIVGKRMIVPFIATPLAGVVEKKMNAKSDTPVEPAKNNPAELPVKEDKTTLQQNSTSEPVPAPVEPKSSNLIENFKSKTV